MKPFDRNQPHPFAVWNETPTYERNRLARRATFHHPTTGDLLASYFADGLHMDGDEVKGADEICRDLQRIVRPNQVIREARVCLPPEVVEQMKGADR